MLLVGFVLVVSLLCYCCCYDCRSCLFLVWFYSLDCLFVVALVVVFICYYVCCHLFCLFIDYYCCLAVGVWLDCLFVALCLLVWVWCFLCVCLCLLVALVLLLLMFSVIAN